MNTVTKDFLFTSESVTEGHPDKICDQISDAILDEYIKSDPDCRVAVETMVTSCLVIVVGEISSTAKITNQQIKDVIRKTISDIGYNSPDLEFDSESCEIILRLHAQSPNIDLGVTSTSKKEQGAGDQGIMFGYATKETEEFMPMPITLAHKLTQKLSQVRKLKEIPWIRPDGKSQVSVEYKNNKPIKITDIVISTQHDPFISNDEIRDSIIKKVIQPVCMDLWRNDIKILINPTGRFEIGGPHSDAGLTGRKIIVDTYGGQGRHGGGSFSGKDPSKVDRSASYMCRYIAKNIVAAGLSDKCEIQVAYAIGIPEPISLMVNTFGTGKIMDQEIEMLVKKHFDLRPASIISKLMLKRPIYKKTAAYGHFGRNEPEFTWEVIDKAETLKNAIGS
ncbi:MAG: methionine adenosyltransferase [Nitrosopumilaceae archaeon]|nr:methionine adenosyltransferase [Nitrosopumilaceae archaeon]